MVCLFETHTQWSKLWLFAVYRWLYYPVVYNKPLHGPPWTNQYLMECHRCFFLLLTWHFNRSMGFLYVRNPIFLNEKLIRSNRGEPIILLMENIPNNYLGGNKPCKSWGNFPTSTGAGFLNHQQYLCPPIEKGNNPSPAVSVNCKSESWDWPTSDRQKHVKPMWITFVWAFENWEWSAREENYYSFNYTSWFVSSYFPTSPSLFMFPTIHSPILHQPLLSPCACENWWRFIKVSSSLGAIIFCLAGGSAVLIRHLRRSQPTAVLGRRWHL